MNTGIFKNRSVIAALIAAFVLLLIAEGVGYLVALKTPSGVAEKNKPSGVALKAKNRALKARFEELRPKGVHIVVDTAGNTLLIKNGEKVVRKALVSSGSGNILADPSGERTWVFDTPRGEFTIKSKAKNPNWIKPDWAFIEEEQPIPKNYKDRAEPGVLGDYALGFGNGYFLHGTLYTRLLGRNVTHGCVRIGDADLKALYETVPLGARIYLF
jgi:L,D-transpeptidase YbiS